MAVVKSVGNRLRGKNLKKLMIVLSKIGALIVNVILYRGWGFQNDYRAGRYAGAKNPCYH